MDENTITILIQAHGEELARHLPYDEHVQLLSFCGYPGEYGNMEIKNGKSLDVEATKYISNLYKPKSTSARNKKSVRKNPQTQSELYSQVALPVRDLYSDFGIKYKDDGFVYTNPSNEREFSFEPTDHENCEICINTINPKTKTNYKTCRQRSIKYCPNYGVAVVSSSDPADLPYTLQYTGTDPNISVEDQIINSTIANGNDIANTHWLNKLEALKSSEKAKLIYLFNFMIRNKGIHLTSIISIFKGLGFTKIYILDPSCRAQPLSFDHEKITRNNRTKKQNAEYANILFKNAATRIMSTNHTAKLNANSGSNTSAYNARRGTIPMTPRGNAEHKRNIQLGIVNHMKSLVSDRKALDNPVYEPIDEYLTDRPSDPEMDAICKNNKNLTFCQTYLPYFFPTGGVNTKKRKIKTRRKNNSKRH